MTTDLFYLALTTGLCLVLWIPYILGLIKARGNNPDDYRNPPAVDDAFLKRANRAHLNLVENLGPFAALVLIAHVADKADSTTATASMVFFWSRVVHAVVHLGGWPYVRTLAFAVGWLSLLAILWRVLA